MAYPHSSSNVTSKIDIGSWVNLTRYAPSAKDLLLAGPRMGMKLGSFVTDVFGGWSAQRIIPEATRLGTGAPMITNTVLAQSLAHAAPDILENANDQAVGGLASKMSLETGRSFGSMINYSTSKWALCCIVMAVILNRTHIYASTRRNIVLGWKVRLALRLTPIILFVIQARWLLQSIQCQTSPDFGMMRWGNASKSSDLMFTQNGGALHTMSSSLLLGASDAESCRAVKMIPSKEADEEYTVDGLVDLSGSLSLLWPLFETICFSQFVETISCAVQGRQVAAETGMTLFEHSLAFAEADAAVSSSLGWGTFGGTRSTTQGSATASQESGSSNDPNKLSEVAINRSMIMKRVNTPPEVLLVGLLSSLNHITSHVLAIFNLQGRLRLVSTAFWGLCFMSTITWSILSFSIDDLENQSLLRFPTVCIIGFIPHVLVLTGIVLCSFIYGIAIVLTALAARPENHNEYPSFWRKLVAAHNNMQANVPLSNIRISMHMDFYTALLRTGFSALTMASEAVYLNESSEVHVRPRTWLEEDRLKELEETGRHWLGENFRHGTVNGVGLVTANGQSSIKSGYARESTAQKTGKLKSTDRVIRDGVGATERSGRWIMAFEFLTRICKLVISWFVLLMLKGLAKAGLRWRPRWLLWLTKDRRKISESGSVREERGDDTLQFWLVNDAGELVLPSTEQIDVEVEMRRRLKGDKPYWTADDEQTLDSSLYDWWLSRGWWGGEDSSGDFTPQENEEDTTSIVSTIDLDTDQDWESDNDDCRRTPTQDSPHFTRGLTPILDTPLSLADLALLLQPMTPEHRAEAQNLAAHLASDKLMTRSRYRDFQQRERAKVLTSTRQHSTSIQSSSNLTAEEETQILEHLIRSRRAFHSAAGASSFSGPSSWADGASGMGEGGPQCVVCQSSPRSIIVWPCRCLSLCDDCRVTLAMNNFDKCVCCRRDVSSFSRIFVP